MGWLWPLEVTGEVDKKRFELAASAGRLSFTHPSSTLTWSVALAAGARVRAISPDALGRLLSDLEASERRSARGWGDMHDPFVARLGALRIESIYGRKAAAGAEGKVVVQAGTYGGWEWNGTAIDEWLDQFFASAQGINKLSKLARAQAAERHLAIVLDSFSPAGIGVPLGLTTRHEPGAADYLLPSFSPPEPLTHLWLLPALAGTRDGLRWVRDSRWEVLEALGSSAS
jgi:hypothetical protein